MAFSLDGELLTAFDDTIIKLQDATAGFSCRFFKDHFMFVRTGFFLRWHSASIWFSRYDNQAPGYPYRFYQENSQEAF
jgi:hypothetical protein